MYRGKTVKISDGRTRSDNLPEYTRTITFLTKTGILHVFFGVRVVYHFGEIEGIMYLFT